MDVNYRCERGIVQAIDSAVDSEKIVVTLLFLAQNHELQNIVFPNVCTSHDHYLAHFFDFTYTLFLVVNGWLDICKASDLEAFSPKPTDNSITSLHLAHIILETRTESSSRTHPDYNHKISTTVG